MRYFYIAWIEGRRLTVEGKSLSDNDVAYVSEYAANLSLNRLAGSRPVEGLQWWMEHVLEFADM